jgi:hypothetical protein
MGDPERATIGGPGRSDGVRPAVGAVPARCQWGSDG